MLVGFMNEFKIGDLIEHKMERLYDRGLGIIIEEILDGDPWDIECFVVYMLNTQKYQMIHKSSIKVMASLAD